MARDVLGHDYLPCLEARGEREGGGGLSANRGGNQKVWKAAAAVAKTRNGGGLK